MGNYKTDHGFQIKRYSSDPPSPIAGEIWYNSTTQKLKVAPLIGAMSSGGNYPISVYSLAGAGTQTAALGTGGLSPGTNPTNTAPTLVIDPRADILFLATAAAEGVKLLLRLQSLLSFINFINSCTAFSSGIFFFTTSRSLYSVIFPAPVPT